MNNEEYVTNVNNGNFPNTIKVPLDMPFIDERGTIQNLWLGNSRSITIITSNKGAVRANHKHKGDWHAIYVISGMLSYQVTYDNKVEETIIKPGEMIFTPPDIYHTVIAIEDATFLTINGIIKNHENYMKTMYKTELYNEEKNQ